MRVSLLSRIMLLAGLCSLGCGPQLSHPQSGDEARESFMMAKEVGASSQASADRGIASSDTETTYVVPAVSHHATTPAVENMDAAITLGTREAQTPRVTDEINHESRLPVQARLDVDQRQSQTGLLTAGSTDDNAGYDEFLRYVANATDGDLHQTLPRIDVGGRVTIEVRNGQGEPICDARVFAEGSPGENPPGLRTGSDGRVLFLKGAYPRHTNSCRVTVFPPDGSEAVMQEFSLREDTWTITLPNVAARLPAKLDLALVIDTTGSMDDELDYLKREIAGIAAAVREQFPQVDQRYSLIVYRDEGDEYVTQTFDFTGSLEELQRNLELQSAAGGGDYPEAMHEALEQAAGLNWRQEGAARVLFLVADAPSHPRFASRTLKAVQDLRSKGVSVFPVAASGVADEAEYIMRVSAFLTLGEYLFLTDHSGIGNPHAQPHVSQYAVERLDRLMIRMIAQKLAGRLHTPGQSLSKLQAPAMQIPEPARAGIVTPWLIVPPWLIAATAVVMAIGIDLWTKAMRNRAVQNGATS
jgi:hypothetical protein